MTEQESYSGRRVVCADPKKEWYGHVGTITNFNKDNAGVRFDGEHDPPATGHWIKKDRLVPVDNDGVPTGSVDDALADEMARINEIASLVAKAKESAALAVDVYNRPGTSFRTAGYLVMMVVAWTSAMLARFRRDKVDPHYFDKKTGLVERVDGSPKTWSPEDCVRKTFTNDRDPVRANLVFAIRLRNKIEHTHCPPLDDSLFGECQATLNNFVAFMKKEFGEEQVLGATLNFALQTSEERSPEQLEALKRYFGPDVEALLDFVGDYREALEDEVYEDHRYRFRVLLVPGTANKARHADTAVTFIHADDPEAADLLKKLDVLIKEKRVEVHGSGKLLPGAVAEKVEGRIGFRFTASTHHARAVKHYEIKGPDPDNKPQRTDSRYCVYSEPHKGYLYTNAWVEKLVRSMQTAEAFKAVTGCEAKLLE